MLNRQAAAVEVNFDGLPGPTHNYSGLATGNLASERNRSSVANPRLAALQGLAKMKALSDRGYPQAVLPPHERPDLAALRALGYRGDDAAVIARAAREDSPLLAACSSAAAMWAANAATVSPSADTADGRVHFTPANLCSHFHRAIEAPTTTRVLRAIFADEARFAVHDPLPARPNSATKARPTTPASPPIRRHPASSSLSTAGSPTPRPRDRRRAFRHGRRAKPRKRSRGATSWIRHAPCSSSRVPRRSTPACSTTTLSPSATTRCCSVTKARSSTSKHCSPISPLPSARRSHRSLFPRRKSASSELWRRIYSTASS